MTTQRCVVQYVCRLHFQTEQERVADPRWARHLVQLADEANAASGRRRAVLSGVRIEHFYETAVTILGGPWEIGRCEIVSSRAPNRACVGVVLRNISSVRLYDCTISGCSAAVLISSAQARVTARETAFSNVRAAIEAVRGGHIDVQRCRFGVGLNGGAHGDVGVRIAADTLGTVSWNNVPNEEYLFGSFAPPARVEVMNNLPAIIEE